MARASYGNQSADILKKGYNSAGAQFFIMTADNTSLDGTYAAFGKVIEGMDIVNKIKDVKVVYRESELEENAEAPKDSDGNKIASDRPIEPPVIKSITVETFGVDYFIGQYYTSTLRYDLRADLNTTSSGTLESYQARLNSLAERVDGIMEQSISLRHGSQSRATLLTVLPEDQLSLYLGTDGTLLEMPDEGIVISAKLCRVMNINIGDTVEITLAGDEDTLHLPVMDTADTNIGQGIFMGKGAWEKLRKGAFHVTSLLLAAPDEECVYRLNQMDEVSVLKYPPEQFKQTMTIMDSTSTAFSILSGAALGLAFVICYNMGLMNFTERTRDYATLKVLGYHQKEIRRLMLRENDITALLGVAFGIPPGVLLVDVILKSCEFESMVFAANITWQSIALASAITFVFTWLIEWVLTRKVRSIDMVEALKSVE